MTMVSKDIYFTQVLPQIPRLLGLLDRRPLSRTYGCFDRGFWLYKTTDTPSARCQEACLTLAILYSSKIPGSQYYGDKTLLDWVNAALSFWSSIQSSNGSFNEWYPNEGSFVATVFSSYAVSETLRVLDDNVQQREQVISSLKKAVSWINGKNEIRVANQQAGTLPLLDNMHSLTGDKRYKKMCRKKRDLLLSLQSPEGWFPEYGGADIGYHSVTIDYLAKYYIRSGDEKIGESLKHALEFLSYFIHPEGSVGGAYGSRNTSYLLPYGIELLADEFANAHLISHALRQALKDKTIIGISSLDDRYLLYNAYVYLQAFEDSRSLGKPGRLRLPCKSTLKKHFPDAGIVIVSDNEMYFITNTRKGGAFSMHGKTKNKGFFEDSGISVTLSDGSTATSSIISQKNNSVIDEDRVVAGGFMTRIPDNTLTPFKNIFLRGFQQTLGKVPGSSDTVKKYLRKKLISGSEMHDIPWERKIVFNTDDVSITDCIGNPEKIEEVVVGGASSYTAIPSSNYITGRKLPSRPMIIKKSAFPQAQSSDAYIVKRRYSKKDCNLKGYSITHGRMPKR